MARITFDRLSYSTVFQQIDPIVKTLVAGAALAELVSFDITPVGTVTITLDVTVADLAGMEVWVRGDKYSRWLPLSVDNLRGYGRTDSGTDINTTPAGQACFFMLDCKGWSDVMVKAKSAGAAKVVITAGGQ